MSRTDAIDFEKPRKRDRDFDGRRDRDRDFGGKRTRHDNADVVKYMEGLAKFEKHAAHKKLRARAICTHTKGILDPNLSYRQENGQMVWFCKACGEQVDLHRLSDDDLNEMVKRINQACDLIKMMSTGSEKDRKIVSEIVADVQMKVNAYLVPLYKNALNSSSKQANRRQQRNRSRISWGE